VARAEGFGCLLSIVVAVRTASAVAVDVGAAASVTAEMVAIAEGANAFVNAAVFLATTTPSSRRGLFVGGCAGQASAAQFASLVAAVPAKGELGMALPGTALLVFLLLHLV